MLAIGGAPTSLGLKVKSLGTFALSPDGTRVAYGASVGAESELIAITVRAPLLQ